MNQNPFRGRPRTAEIHDGVMNVYKNIANGNIVSYSGIISFMKMSDQYGKISNLYKIRNQISSHLKDIAEDVLKLDHYTIEYIFSKELNGERISITCAKICLQDDYYNKVISKNVTYYEYIQKLVSLNEKPSEIAKQMISLGIKDKKCTELFLEYVAHD